MTKKCLSFGWLLLAAVCGVGFSSCKPEKVIKPDEPVKSYELNITVENGSMYSSIIDTVKAFMEGDQEDVALATAGYNNGVIKLQLPLTISEGLFSYSDFFPEGLTVSNPNVKLNILYIEAYKNDSYVGDFYYALESYTQEIDGTYMYSDTDCSIQGTLEDEEFEGLISININLKAGWNLVYIIEQSERAEFTTTPQSGLKWFFSDYGPEYAPRKAHKKLSANFAQNR
ncbi:MAG: hypothetical protein LBT04_06575 [Prevotellaceae bacterium]|jgi:hypothetical protein|nr:hypothetical protein [Prevotellaceae bacterium]